MDVCVQSDYLQKIQSALADESIDLFSDVLRKSDLAVFDDQHIPQPLQLKGHKNKILICSQNTVDLRIISSINPIAIVNAGQYERIVEQIKRLSATKTSVFNSADLQPMDESGQIESLKKELQEKSESLKYFVNEENLKKQKEKKLLYFLDFLNAEHDRADFIDNLCDLLWSDFKKLGSFYTLGFILTFSNEENTLILFDGKQVKINYNISFLENEKPYAAQLADILQRPLAVTRFWETRKNSLTSFFFLENRSSSQETEALESYISERLDLMILMIQRHISQLQTSYLLNKWNVFGKAYQQPMHVIDSDFNLVQSNYISQAEQAKCFEKLAGRTLPCENCPVQVQKNVSSVNIEQKKYKSYITKFHTDRDYYFVFYENQTESDRIRSDLIQNEKMNVIGQLANHLAHELNNPLTGLKLAAEFVLQNPQLEAGVRSDFNEVLKGINRCKNIISDLLEFSSDKDPALTMGTIDDVIKKTMPLLKSLTRNVNIFIDVKSVPVKLNPGHLQQIIFNLVKNSCQAIATKGSVKIYDIDSAANYDVIIEDNGSGLPDRIKSHLFQPFSTTKASGEGTGLGLYISKSLIKRMNADLLYDANYKNGTRFILRFFK